METAQNTESLDARVLSVTGGITLARDRIDFMNVARALVHQAHLKSPESSRVMAENLGISRQTRHNWLQPDSLAEWLVLWEQRLQAARPAGPLPAFVKHRISEADWDWIAEVIATYGGRSWAKKRWAVAHEAAKDSAKAHLRGINRVTLYRNRDRLTGHGERLRREKMSGAGSEPAELPKPTMTINEV